MPDRSKFCWEESDGGMREGAAGTTDPINAFRQTEAPEVGKTGRPDPARVSQTHSPRLGKPPRNARIHRLASSVLS